MKNADMPAMPKGLFVENGELYGNDDSELGLTKREHFAAMAMNGFISAGVNGMPNPDEIALLATKYADAILEELDKCHQ